MRNKKWPVSVSAGMGIFLFIAVCFYVMPCGAQDYRSIKRNKELSHSSGKIGKYTALIIGINDYEDDDIPDLKTAVSDAETMKDILGSRYGFQDIKLLKNRQATKSAIVKAFRSMIGELGTDDSLLVYYAGHGELDRLVEGNGWWVPADARAEDITTYLENSTVQNYLKAMKTRHVLLISDSCYSGTLFGESRALPPVIDDQFYLELYNEKSRWGMTSGNKTPVSDSGSGGHSVFAYQLIRELEKNRKPYLTPREIYTAVGPVIRNNSEQMPLCRPIKMTGDAGGEFIFILAGGSIVVDKPERDSSPRTGSLLVETKPSGAKVYVNGVSKGASPAELTGLNPGTVTVQSVLSGYSTQEKEVSVEAGRIRQVTLVMDRIQEAEPEEPQKSSGEKKITNSIGMEFVYIPPGSFMMGSPSNEPEREDDEKQHRVTLTKGFYMQTTEVTQGQWKAVMGNNPSYFKNCGDNCPVEQVSWDDAQEFIKKLNRKEGKTYRLPTEAEWEYAARAGSETAYCFGNDAAALGKYAWYGQNSGGKTYPAGQKQPNAFGLYDMHGNVWEWCQDWYGDYASGAVTDPVGPDSVSDRVLRGGSGHNNAQYCRSARRVRDLSASRGSHLGFRLVLPVGQQR